LLDKNKKRRLRKWGVKYTAHNGRFGKIAALPPHKRQCELGSYYPARTFVKPLPRQAAASLEATLGKRPNLDKLILYKQF